jgi:deoxyribonuclease V
MGQGVKKPILVSESPSPLQGEGAGDRGHRWDLSIAEARKLQERLAKHVLQTPFRRRSFVVAGTDVSFDDDSHRAVAGIVAIRVPSLETVAEVWGDATLTFPYVPGFLSFREAPALLAALEKLAITPDILMVDGQGIAHPRRFGIASHLGLLTGIPSIGCAKSRLVGTHREPGRTRGARAALLIEKERVGAVVRTRDGVSPVYISLGHLVDIRSAVRVVLACAITRVPEPTRRAHILVTRVMRCAPAAR